METTTVIFVWLIVLSVFLLLSLVGLLFTHRFITGLIECIQSLVYAYQVQGGAIQKIVQVLRQEGNLLRGLRDLNGLKQRLEDAKGQLKTYPRFDNSGGPHGRA